MQKASQSSSPTGLRHHHSQEILDWPDFRRLISEEPHRRCFLDNFRLRGMRKILVGTKNRGNKSFAGDKLGLLNSGGEESQLGPINNRRRPQREPPAWQHVNITLSVSRRTWLFGKSHLLKQHQNVWRYLTNETKKIREKKKAEQLIFETSRGKKIVKSKTRLLCWSLSVRLLDQTALSNFQHLSEILRSREIKVPSSCLAPSSPASYICHSNASQKLTGWLNRKLY